MSIEIINEKLQAVAQYAYTAMELKDVEGFLVSIEGYALYLLAHDGPGSGAIVEIGSFMGLSTCWLALGSKAANREPVTAVDHFEGSAEHQAGEAAENPILSAEGTTFNRFQDNVSRMNVASHVEPIRATSADAAAGWTRPIRLLFIDGDHSYDGVTRDFALWARFVVQGGLVALHDVQSAPGVSRFYEEIRAPGSGYTEYFRVQDLGVLFKI